MAKFTLMVETEDSAEIAHIANAINGSPLPAGDTAVGRVLEAADTAATPAPKPRGRQPKPVEQATDAEKTAAIAAGKADAGVEEIETVKGITAEDLMDPPVVSFDEVKAAMLDLIEKKDADMAKKILVENGVTGRLGEAPKEKYPALLAAFQAAA